MSLGLIFLSALGPTRGAALARPRAMAISVGGASFLRFTLHMLYIVRDHTYFIRGTLPRGGRATTQFHTLDSIYSRIAYILYSLEGISMCPGVNVVPFRYSKPIHTCSLLVSFQYFTETPDPDPGPRKEVKIIHQDASSPLLPTDLRFWPDAGWAGGV